MVMGGKDATIEQAEAQFEKLELKRCLTDACDDAKADLADVTHTGEEYTDLVDKYYKENLKRYREFRLVQEASAYGNMDDQQVLASTMRPVDSPVIKKTRKKTRKKRKSSKKKVTNA